MTAFGREEKSIFGSSYTVSSLLLSFLHFRTIMNCSLKVIQARAFAQNPHLRYMWVNTLSLKPCFPCLQKIYYDLCSLSACYIWLYMSWCWTDDDALDRDGFGKIAITVATAAHLKWDIHYLPWIIGFLSAPVSLCFARATCPRRSSI